MLIDKPLKANGVLCVFDTNSLTDLRLAKQGAPGQPVMRASPFLKEMFGPHFRHTTRLALFPHGAKPGPQERAAAVRELHEVLPDYQVVCLFPTPGKHMQKKGAEQSTKNTLSWQSLRAPGDLDSMRGTFWYTHRTIVVPMYPLVPVIDELFKVMNQRWAQWAVSWAQGPLTYISPLQALTTVEEPTLHALQTMQGQALAIDIETIDSKGIITAMNLAGGNQAVSIPWDRYQPSKVGFLEEPGILEYGALGKQIWAQVQTLLEAPTQKVLQNKYYDLVRLRERGYKINGPEFDTLAAHAITYLTLPHNLQALCASLFPVSPWKSLFKCDVYDKESDERAWHYEPAALRQYGVMDAWNTLLAASRLDGLLV
jgi:hypothetical protein